MTDNYQKFFEDNYTFHVKNEYKVQNNVWGFYAGAYDSKYTQCVFKDPQDSDLFGWEWNLESPSKLPSYPRVEFGWNPWESESTTEKLPRQIETLKSVNVSFEQNFSSNGVYNTSFDIWVSNSEIPDSDNIAAEIMIWVDANKVPDTPMTKGNIIIGNESYDFYKNTSWNDFPLFIFIKKDKQWTGEMEILPVFNYLAENHHISPKSYLADIEFGNEIWSGYGSMELRNYRIEVK